MFIRLFLLSLYNWGVANSETKLQQEIRLALGTIPSLRLFRNQVGQLPDPRTGRYVQFGLAKGSSDLVGFKTIKITPEMIGQEVAQFVSIEIKTERGKLTEVQENWLQKVKSSGGIVGVARSIQDALKIVKVS
jgi:hypothetical protein|tara:strand:- start:555 stop:953 length:399 start_codon:yes stop_codon:yes gene_type:complete